MKPLVCEMCGSQNLVKDNGVFVCQYCGCKYSVAEAKKMMIEGVVTIDETSKVDNWLQLANSAFNNSNWDEAYRYCCKVLEVNPNNWIATYKKGLSIGWESSLANIRYNEVIGGINDATSQLLNNTDYTDEYKADGIIAMMGHFNIWINALIEANVNHTVEFADTLPSTCNTYYERLILIAKLLEFEVNMVNEFAIMNVSDLDTAKKIVTTSHSLKECVIKNFTDPLIFNPPNIRSTFSRAYDSTSAKKAFDSLLNTRTVDFYFWLANREESDKKKRIKKFLDENPDFYDSLHTKESELRKSNSEIKKALESLNSAQKEFVPVKLEFSKIEQELDANNTQISKLRKKIFRKNEALAEADRLESINNDLTHRLDSMLDEYNSFEDKISTARAILRSKKENANQLQHEIEDMKKCIS